MDASLQICGQGEGRTGKRFLKCVDTQCYRASRLHLETGVEHDATEFMAAFMQERRYEGGCSFVRPSSFSKKDRQKSAVTPK